MSEYQRIEYHISKDGKITEKVINGQGETCTNITKDIEKTLGQIEKQELLPEYYENNEQIITEENQSLNQW
jgi:hypothetical protein